MLRREVRRPGVARRSHEENGRVPSAKSESPIRSRRPRGLRGETAGDLALSHTRSIRVARKRAPDGAAIGGTVGGADDLGSASVRRDTPPDRSRREVDRPAPAEERDGRLPGPAAVAPLRAGPGPRRERWNSTAWLTPAASATSRACSPPPSPTTTALRRESGRMRDTSGPGVHDGVVRVEEGSPSQRAEPPPYGAFGCPTWDASCKRLKPIRMLASRRGFEPLLPP